jgi:hypothetical protein
MKIMAIAMFLCGAFCVNYSAEASRRVKMSASEHDGIAVAVLRSNCSNCSNWKEIATRWKRYTKAQLYPVAIALAEKNGSGKPDRLTRRRREALLWWFAKNAPDFFPENFPSAVPAATTTEHNDDDNPAVGPIEHNDETNWNFGEEQLGFGAEQPNFWNVQ